MDNGPRPLTYDDIIGCKDFTGSTEQLFQNLVHKPVETRDLQPQFVVSKTSQEVVALLPVTSMLQEYKHMLQDRKEPPPAHWVPFLVNTASPQTYFGERTVGELGLDVITSEHPITVMGTKIMPKQSRYSAYDKKEVNVYHGDVNLLGTDFLSHGDLNICYSSGTAEFKIRNEEGKKEAPEVGKDAPAQEKHDVWVAMISKPKYGNGILSSTSTKLDKAGEIKDVDDLKKAILMTLPKTEELDFFNLKVFPPGALQDTSLKEITDMSTPLTSSPASDPYLVVCYCSK